MRKTLIVLSLVSAGLAAGSVMAQDTTSPHTAQTGWYVSADAGQARVSKGPYNDGDTTGGLKAGYRFEVNPHTSLGLEVGYQYLGILDPHARYADRVTGSGRSQLRGATAGVDFRYNISPRWYAEWRGGAFRAQASGLTDRYPGTRYRRDVTHTNYYAGVGVGYNVDRDWSLGVNYDHYKGTDDAVRLDTNAYTMSAEYRF
ncbi:porin family protein [Oleiagrimonas sp. C23AA]|uniref:porin family protein n=1 Tax=Oleiagrimonas sp. C23AA TaxID=2719047 RepID=UPI00142016F5|nr:porin family protein [Oleiagrimonas sp. C23AA]NII12367.1 porin family protein [Oleiagrimonas sp. C23AA]